MTTGDFVSKSALEEVSEPTDDTQKSTSDTASSNSSDDKKPPPLSAKLFAVALIASISFGSHWSSGVTGAMKSTLKKVIARPLTPSGHSTHYNREWISTTCNSRFWKPVRISWLLC